MVRRTASLAICITFCTLVVGGSAFDLRSSYQREYEHETFKLEGIAYLVSEWIKGHFLAFDYVLRDIATEVSPDELRLPHADDPRAQARLSWLQAKQSTIQYAESISLLDADCHPTHQVPPHSTVTADPHEYCQALKRNPALESIVTPSPQPDATHYTVVQARKIVDASGNFRGVVAIGISSKLFANLLTKITFSTQSVVTITDNHLVLLARMPARESDVGRVVGSHKSQAFVTSDKISAIFHNTSPLDHVTRLTGAQKVQGLPFLVYVGEPDRQWLANWYRQIVQYSVISLLLVGAALMAFRHHLKLIKHNSELKKFAITDELSNTYNRRYFQERAALEIQRARLNKTHLMLMLMDIDNFKRINDEFGHSVGDRAIIAFTRACRNYLRDADLLGRLGGDEFVALMPGIEPNRADEIAERVRAAIASAPLHTDDDQLIPLTTSIGAVIIAPGDHAIEQIIIKADELLYSAKREGRNQVCLGTFPSA
ncbi:sensor domain-containing diguanylate cyclase [Uliginosibacterium gangwonense]|uniref:sensor domain-containing diguanylate cyclase n=1 Tax=Uliginosibacterium gangwonense TaxID=392736 RepID=UPI0003A21741|nr:sensor domain-containing diguanylate cyclase [Uliginosibacterium gangwonense]